MNVGVTGAGGFIGSHLCDELVARGDVVVGSDIHDRIPTNLAELESTQGFSYAKGDVTDPASLSKAFSRPLDAIFHMAASVGVDSYVSDPVGTIDSILNGTRNVLGFCSRTKARLIAMSTSEIYGKNPEVPWKETSDRVLGPPSVDRWSYASSKALGEHLINAVARKEGTRTTIVRPFNVYGPRQRPSFVIPAVIRSVLNEEPPIIYDDGKQTRCFTFVRDLVNGLLACVDNESVLGETFNMGSEEESTINETVDLILAACGSTLKPLHIDPSEKFGNRYEDIGRRVPDCSKARARLGWVAETSLRSGLTQTVDWFRTNG